MDTPVAKASKSFARYQPHPKGREHCDDCTMFEPAASPAKGAMGTCTAVAGLINPKGWCRWFTEATKAHNASGKV